MLDNFRWKSTGTVHAGHMETIIVHLLCKWSPHFAIVIEDEVEYTEDPVNCKTCLKILAKRGC